MKYTVEITSVPDRKKLVAEIWNNDQMIAEVNQENGELNVEFYFQINEESIALNYYALIDALEIAKKRLLE